MSLLANTLLKPVIVVVAQSRKKLYRTSKLHVGYVKSTQCHSYNIAKHSSDKTAATENMRVEFKTTINQRQEKILGENENNRVS